MKWTKLIHNKYLHFYISHLLYFSIVQGPRKALKMYELIGKALFGPLHV